MEKSATDFSSLPRHADVLPTLWPQLPLLNWLAQTERIAEPKDGTLVFLERNDHDDHDTRFFHLLARAAGHGGICKL